MSGFCLLACWRAHEERKPGTSSGRSGKTLTKFDHSNIAEGLAMIMRQHFFCLIAFTFPWLGISPKSLPAADRPASPTAVPAPSKVFTKADYQRHIEGLKKRFAERRFLHRDSATVHRHR